MKAGCSDKEIKAAWAAVREVEKLSAVIAGRGAAERKLWADRRAELGRLEAELACESFDPDAPGFKEATAKHTERVARIEAFKKVVAGQPREFKPHPGAEGPQLFAAIVELQKQLWAICEPFELNQRALTKCGFFGFNIPYTVESGGARIVAWSRNFTMDAAGRIVALAEALLSRKVPPTATLPVNFGMTPRTLSFAEEQYLEKFSKPVAAAS
jgi:hypothetical protein